MLTKTAFHLCPKGKHYAHTFLITKKDEKLRHLINTNESVFELQTPKIHHNTDHQS